VLYLIILFFITQISTGFSISDIAYFYYGLSSLLILFTLQIVSLNMQNYKEDFVKLATINQQFIIISALFSALYLSSFYPQPELNIKLKSLSQIDDKYAKINSILEKPDKINFAKLLIHPFENYLPKNIDRPMWVFRIDLYKFLSIHKIPKHEASLYIPKKIFEEDIAKFKGPSWGRGMLIYAVTGVPLVNGIKKLQKNYGYADYTQDSLWINKEKFQPEKACALIPSKYIIITNNFFNPNFDFYQCRDR